MKVTVTKKGWEVSGITKAAVLREIRAGRIGEVWPLTSKRKVKALSCDGKAIRIKVTITYETLE